MDIEENNVAAKLKKIKLNQATTQRLKDLANSIDFAKVRINDTVHTVVETVIGETKTKYSLSNDFTELVEHVPPEPPKVPKTEK